ncbi:hypothetical protein NITMOv2_4390 [Nitrospira moscoviensis]|uniref:Uncharacterized protein n=1 Tax=Nitrospira moscoviensis TaxID=42253 RepID=A0A0K2GII9_NITMO|nr:hypothetical protein NITMOv2_4390 [Nitrospira moscoviensis]
MRVIEAHRSSLIVPARSHESASSAPVADAANPGDGHTHPPSAQAPSARSRRLCDCKLKKCPLEKRYPSQSQTTAFVCHDKQRLPTDQATAKQFFRGRRTPRVNVSALRHLAISMPHRSEKDCFGNPQKAFNCSAADFVVNDHAVRTAGHALRISLILHEIFTHS